MDKKSKSERIILHEEDKEDKEMVGRIFEFQLPIVEDAMQESLNTAFKEYGEGKGKIGVIDYDSILEKLKKELKENNPALALAIIEAGLYSVSRERESLERKRGETKNINDGFLLDRIDLMLALETRYSETEDFFFTHSDFAEILPSKDHLLEWVADEKRNIEKLAKDETKKEALKKIYASRLRSEVPAYDRFLTGRQVIDDYDILLSALEERLQMIRGLINDALLEYMATKNEAKMAEMKRNSKLVYTLRSFLALMEGERNEKIAIRR